MNHRPRGQSGSIPTKQFSRNGKVQGNRNAKRNANFAKNLVYENGNAINLQNLERLREFSAEKSQVPEPGHGRVDDHLQQPTEPKKARRKRAQLFPNKFPKKERHVAVTFITCMRTTRTLCMTSQQAGQTASSPPITRKSIIGRRYPKREQPKLLIKDVRRAQNRTFSRHHGVEQVRHVALADEIDAVDEISQSQGTFISYK